MPVTRRPRRVRGPYNVEKKDTVILVRLTSEEKTAFTAAAHKAQRTLSTWLREVARRSLPEKIVLQLTDAEHKRKRSR
jgi:hypothetical protein